MKSQYVKNGKKVEVKAKRNVTLMSEYAKVRQDVNAVSFKATDNNPNNPANWISSNEALDKEIAKRKKALVKHFENSSKDDLLQELTIAFISIDIKNMALNMAIAANARNALANKETFERAIHSAKKRNHSKSEGLKIILNKIRTELIADLRPIKRALFFSKVKVLFPHASDPTIQSWWGKLKNEFI